MSRKARQVKSPSSALPALLTGTIILMAALIVHAPAMKAGFIWDDDTFLHNNPLIKAHDGLRRFWFTTQAEDYFPLTYSMLWAEWRMWGPRPSGYHVVNVLLHAASAILLWRVLKRLNVPAAWLGGLLFAVHPVATSSVAWVTERKNTLSLALYLATTLAYLRFDDSSRRRDYFLALGLFLLALFSKSSVVVLPPLLLLCAWWRRRQVRWLDVKRLAPFFALALVFGVLQLQFHHIKTAGIPAEERDSSTPPAIIPKTVIARPEGFFSRLAASGWAVWFYLYKDLLPHPLMMVYPRWSVDPARPVVWLPLAALILTFAVLWRYRASWGRAPLFALAYVVISLGPVLGFLEISYMEYSLVTDHWQYIALPGMIGLAAGLVGWGWRHPPWRMLLGASALSAFGALSVLAFQHAKIFKNEETLWRHNVKYHDFAACHVSLGNMRLQRGDNAGAMREFEQSLRIDPDFSAAAFNLGAMYYTQSHQPGLSIERRRESLDKAIEYFQRRAKLNPDPGTMRLLDQAASERNALGG